VEREARDRKRKQKAIERVRVASQKFETEFNRSMKQKGYSPDLDDLEALARYFEGAAKCMKKLNDKASKGAPRDGREEECGLIGLAQSGAGDSED
jgi:hypothetical protein